MSVQVRDAEDIALEARFYVLADRWRRETRHLSSIPMRAMHFAYQQIIGMGDKALPLILRELAREPDDWFWALHAITGADPVPEQDRGIPEKMAQAWLRYGQEHGCTP